MPFSWLKRLTGLSAAINRGCLLIARVVLLCILTAFSPIAGFAQVSYTINPSRAQFAKTTVGIVSHDTTFVLANTGSTDLNVESITLSPSQFHLATGWAPTTASPGKSVPFGVNFAPDSAKTFNGQLTIYITGASPLILPLRGTGSNTAARVSLSTPSLTFLNQNLGTSSASQSVTVSNVGTDPLTVQSINIDPPFTLQGFVAPTTLQPGGSLPLAVTFSASGMGTFYNAMVFTYDVLPPNAVSLTGTTMAATSFASCLMTMSGSPSTAGPL